jgi:hypothetical protein
LPWRESTLAFSTYASDLKRRALEALEIYVGDTQRLRGSIASAVKIISANGPPT